MRLTTPMWFIVAGACLIGVSFLVPLIPRKYWRFDPERRPYWFRQDTDKEFRQAVLYVRALLVLMGGVWIVLGSVLWLIAAQGLAPRAL